MLFKKGNVNEALHVGSLMTSTPQVATGTKEEAVIYAGNIKEVNALVEMLAATVTIQRYLVPVIQVVGDLLEFVMLTNAANVKGEIIANSVMKKETLILVKKVKYVGHF